MAEDSSASRTEPPSDKKLARARAMGDVPRSAELAAAFSLLVFLALLGVQGAHGLEVLSDFLRQSLMAAADPAATFSFASLSPVLQMLMVWLAFLFAAVLAGWWLLSGWVFAPAAMHFSAARIGLIERLLRPFRGPGLLAAALAAARLPIVLALLAFFALSVLAAGPIFDVGQETLLRWLRRLLAVVLVFAIADAVLRWWMYRRGLAMTLAEVRAEAREDELDPQLRGRLRARQVG
jgi:flagellar biosynthetic protein FlhB